MPVFHYMSDTYAVAPQITLEDVEALAAEGFRTIVCNRPDEEVPADICAEAVKAECERAGLNFILNPLSHGTLNMDHVNLQRQATEAEAPVLAYCASGNRCSILWGLAVVGDVSTDHILEVTTKAGYNLTGLVPQLEEMAKSRNS